VSPCLSIQSLLAVRNSLTRWMLDSAIIVGHNVCQARTEAHARVRRRYMRNEGRGRVG
jgi:hypothetical protein